MFVQMFSKFNKNGIANF